MSDLVLVTGASGYVAGHIILQLLVRGYRVRGTIRSLTRADEIRHWLEKAHGASISKEALDLVEADLNSDRGWDTAMQGVRYALHVASPFPPSIPKNVDELIAPARDGTLRVMYAASRAKVERVVQTSSTVAIAYGHDNLSGRVFTEKDWTNSDHPEINAYAKSKTIAERAAWEELAKLNRAIEWVVINPGGVLGPVFDKDASASVDIVKKLLDKSVPGLPRFGFPIVDVRDLADLHVRAMLDPKAAGERSSRLANLYGWPILQRCSKPIWVLAEKQSHRASCQILWCDWWACLIRLFGHNFMSLAKSETYHPIKQLKF